MPLATIFVRGASPEENGVAVEDIGKRVRVKGKIGEIVRLPKRKVSQRITKPLPPTPSPFPLNNYFSLCTCHLSDLWFNLKPKV